MQKKVTDLNAETKAMSETVDSLQERTFQLNLGEFIGDWESAGGGGKWRDYIDQFGWGFLCSLFIEAIGRMILEKLKKFLSRSRRKILQNYRMFE